MIIRLRRVGRGIVRRVRVELREKKRVRKMGTIMGVLGVSIIRIYMIAKR